MTNNEHRGLEELLPAYLEQSLGQEMKDIVERHLVSCEDCRGELDLLRVMAAEPVPDPGEAFWTAFPGRVSRELDRNEKEHRGLFGLLRPFRVSPWAWTMAIALLIAIGGGYFLKAAPQPTAESQVADTGGVYVDVLESDQVRISELNAPEIRSLDSWASKELSALSLREGAAEMFLNAPDGAIDERLSQMNKRELEHLSSVLDTQNEEDGS